jgi:hypothetical protein
MSVEAVISTQVIDTTSVGRSIMTAANAAAVRSAIDFTEAVDDEVSSLLVAGTNITITYNDAANTLTIASTAGGLSGTGSVDNAVLRADGAGGATLQNSAWIINDNLTASPNNTVNHACLEATGGTTNVSVSIKPKGTGAFCLSPPDGTAAGGNARGANAVDLSTSRSSASQVASGPFSFAAGRSVTASGSDAGATAFGDNCVASGSRAFVCNHNSTASGSFSFAAGLGATASGQSSFAMAGAASAANAVSFGGTASGVASFAIAGSTVSSQAGVAIGSSVVLTSAAICGIGSGNQSRAFRYAEQTHSGGVFTFGGDCQVSRFHARCKTTNATPTEMFLDGSAARISVSAQPADSSRVCLAFIKVLGVKSDGSAVACYLRKACVKNISGTTSLVGSVETIGTDIEDNAATNVTVSADNTNDAIEIDVTGIAGETWRWTAVIELLEVAPGT